jgi:hypothetical protein
MSIVSDFAKSMSTKSFQMIGAEPVTVDGVSFDCILAEIDNGKDFATGGFDVSKRLQAVCRTDAMPSVVVLKKLAKARGQNFRIDGIRTGGTFVTITLIEEERA